MCRGGGCKSVAFVQLPSTPSQESPLASGMAPAREAEKAEAMPEVQQGRYFAGPGCSDL